MAILQKKTAIGAMLVDVGVDILVDLGGACFTPNHHAAVVFAWKSPCVPHAETPSTSFHGSRAAPPPPPPESGRRGGSSSSCFSSLCLLGRLGHPKLVDEVALTLPHAGFVVLAVMTDLEAVRDHTRHRRRPKLDLDGGGLLSRLVVDEADGLAVAAHRRGQEEPDDEQAYAPRNATLVGTHAHDHHC